MPRRRVHEEGPLSSTERVLPGKRQPLRSHGTLSGACRYTFTHHHRADGQIRRFPSAPAHRGSAQPRRSAPGEVPGGSQPWQAPGPWLSLWPSQPRSRHLAAPGPCRRRIGRRCHSRPDERHGRSMAEILIGNEHQLAVSTFKAYFTDRKTARIAGILFFHVEG